jgi:hypothetical protein
MVAVPFYPGLSFCDKDEPNVDWTAVQKVTVGALG